ncbi:hypothetical protein ACEPAH_6249 [Sanghuangporus vaninii]
MPIFNELHAFSTPEDAPDWTFVLRPPTERYQWPQFCNRFNQENYEEEIVPLCPGKYFDDLYDKWHSIHTTEKQGPKLMIPDPPNGELIRLSNARTASIRRLNDDAFLTYTVELEVRALNEGQIDFNHEPTYRNIMGIYHSAAQICAYRRDLLIAITNRMMRWSHYHSAGNETMRYINYLADKTGFYAVGTTQYTTLLNTTKYYEGTVYQRTMRKQGPPNQMNGIQINEVEHHIVEGEEVNYDPQYLIELNENKEEARERLEATRHPIDEDLMISIYQYPNELYQPDKMLTMSMREDSYMDSDDTESSEEDGSTEPLPTPEDSAQASPAIEELDDM